jgi:hypothetical protein
MVNNKQTRCHGTVIVGYGKSSEGVPYWTLKKGIDGYMYFVRGSGKGLYGINKHDVNPIRNVSSQ